ncbi:uncharacterized protein LOC110250314 [Exaiptasia diaphana]|uniref:Uncharacterized protein n=1 Tax=Exaiptasia diaphana TaxID=2652724 RepID=A0A913YS67_EXADI|nr:uncharacterized protein LOC110250314 [Exaiptasia diaphana]
MNFAGILVALMLVPLCSGGICDEGPPGKFCEPNLTGYHDCVYNPKTGKVEDHVYECPPKTRCTCMGIPCQTSNPCGNYTLPPVWPQDYTADFNTIDKICSPAGCHTTYSRFAMWRDTVNRKYRQDNTIAPHDPAYEYFIVLANKQSTYDLYHVIPSATRCTKSIISTFPKKITDIGTFFKYDGTEEVTGIITKRWLWKSGGRNSGIPINTYIWNSYSGKPLQFRMELPGSQMSKTSRNFQAYAGTFVPGTPDQEVFVLPNYCEGGQQQFDVGEFEEFQFFKPE